MTNPKVGLLWFAAAILFFVAAMIRDENRAVYIAVGVVFLVLGTGFTRKKKVK